jgi:hypothetical protein
MNSREKHQCHIYSRGRRLPAGEADVRKKPCIVSYCVVLCFIVLCCVVFEFVECRRRDSFRGTLLTEYGLRCDGVAQCWVSSSLLESNVVLVSPVWTCDVFDLDWT